MSTAEQALLITLALPNPAEKEAMGYYAKESGKLAKQYGAQVIARFHTSEHLHGTNPAGIIGIATFPSADAIKEMFNSEAYQELLPYRDKAIQALSIYISAPNQDFHIELNDEKSYLVTMAVPNMNEKAALAQYQQGVGPIAGKHGAKPIGRIGIAESFYGDTPAGFLSVAEFSSEDDIRGFFSDEAYQPFTPLRDKALSSLNLYIAK